VPNRLPQPPDAMPLREALRAMRHMLRKGGETLIETMPNGPKSGPGAKMARVVLREVEAFAKGVDQMTSGVAKIVLGAAEQRAPTLHDTAGPDVPDAAFSVACYAALRAVMGHLGVSGVFISEAGIRHAYQDIAGQLGQRTDSAIAADLTLALLDARVIKGATAAEAAQVPGAALEQVAVFSVMLWLQTDRPDGEDAAALQAASDLSVALAPEIAAACTGHNATKLAALFGEFAPRV
jgi:hypothetical protein